MEYIERAKLIKKELENVNCGSCFYSRENPLPKVDGFKIFTSKYLTEQNRAIYFKDGYLLDSMEYEFGEPEGICTMQNFKRIVNLVKEVKEADPSERTLNKLEDITKKLEEFLLENQETKNEPEERD